MSPEKVEADDTMQDYNNHSDYPNTKVECSSPASTKSESYSKPFITNGRLKAEEHDAITSPSASSRKSVEKRIIAPSQRDKQLMRQVSGLDLDDFERTEQEGGAEEGRIRVGGGVLGGIIAPTRRQRQLMRQVSGLGLEDPVFGKHLSFDDSFDKKHASFIFDDMDINDIPEDMRDMISLASDRTDVVEMDDGQSIDSKSFASLPPLGLEPGATEAQLPSSKKKLRKGRKPRRKSKDQSTCQSVTSDPIYVPPAAVFGTKSKRRGSNDAERRSSLSSIPSVDKALAVDNALAAQVDAILSMNEAKKSNDYSGHSRSSYTGHSRNSRTGLKRGNRPKPRRQDSRFSTTSNTYVPPSIHSDGPSQRGERYLPESMDDIFSSKKSPSTKRGKKKKSTTEEKKKKKFIGKPLKTKTSRDADWTVS
jgi:hypothetical protein